MPAEPFSESIVSEDALNRARAYVFAQAGNLDRERHPTQHAPGPAVTVSRESGCGAREVVRHLAGLLDEDCTPKPACNWTVFDRQLIEKVLEEHHLPAELAPLIPEDRRFYLKETAADLLGVQPATWKLVPDIIETILHLVEVGQVIVVGRGCNVITAGTPNVFHVRLVAPLEQRIEHMSRANGISREEAARFIAKEDRGRAGFVKSYFTRRIDDPLLYHAVVNTGRQSYEDAARLIADGAKRFFAHRQTQRR